MRENKRRAPPFRCLGFNSPQNSAMAMLIGNSLELSTYLERDQTGDNQHKVPEPMKYIFPGTGMQECPLPVKKQELMIYLSIFYFDLSSLKYLRWPANTIQKVLS